MIRLALIFIALAGAVHAQNAGASALAARAQLEQASRDLAAAQSAQDRVDALTGVVHAYEDGLVALREGLRRVTVREDMLTRQLEAKSAEIAQLLGVLQSMGRAPAPLLLLHPNGPVGTARGGMILSDVTPALQAEAEAVAAQLDEVTALRAVQDGAAQTLLDGLDGAAAARAALAKAVSERAPLPRRYDDDPVQTALMVASAQTLEGLAKMLSEVDARGVLPAADALPRDLPMPVSGVVLRGFGEADATGTVRPGVVVAARPRALVTVPETSTLRFSGGLLDYGTVAILEPAADMLVVIAGLEEVFGQVGEVLPAGSPLGLMGGTPDGADGNAGAETRSESLYIEVRLDGEPVDPGQWFVLE